MKENPSSLDHCSDELLCAMARKGGARAEEVLAERLLSPGPCLCAALFSGGRRQ